MKIIVVRVSVELKRLNSWQSEFIDTCGIQYTHAHKIVRKPITEKKKSPTKNCVHNVKFTQL